MLHGMTLNSWSSCLYRVLGFGFRCTSRIRGLCSTEDQTHGLVHVKQTITNEVTSPVFIFLMLPLLFFHSLVASETHRLWLVTISFSFFDALLQSVNVHSASCMAPRSVDTALTWTRSLHWKSLSPSMRSCTLEFKKKKIKKSLHL